MGKLLTVLVRYSVDKLDMSVLTDHELPAKRLQWPVSAFGVITCACASMLNTAFHNRGRPGGQTIASPQLLLGSSFLNVRFVKEADEISARVRTR